jgi:hypothetical protein
MKINYFHVRDYNGFLVAPRGGTTLAMEQIEGWYFDTLEVGTFFEKSIGKARCSKKDNYCKKVGRELAVGRMKTTRLTVIAVVDEPSRNTRVVALRDSKDNSLYLMRKKAGTSRVYLSNYDEDKDV